MYVLDRLHEMPNNKQPYCWSVGHLGQISEQTGPYHAYTLIGISEGPTIIIIIIIIITIVTAAPNFNS